MSPDLVSYRNRITELLAENERLREEVRTLTRALEVERYWAKVAEDNCQRALRAAEYFRTGQPQPPP